MAPGARARVLIVEDDPDQFDAMAGLLYNAGYDVEHARDGAEALAVISRFQPDVLVTDLVMPVMSGEELLRSIRERSGPHPQIVVVSGLEALGERCASLGAVGCLVKPLDAEKLLETVARAIDGTRTTR
jgi:CheY-like chemotaxis protein